MKMYEAKESIKTQPYDDLQIAKLLKNDTFEVLCISLEKDAVFPEHTSPTDALLVVIEGMIDFHINEKCFRLNGQEHFSFPKDVVHWVKAKENSKFLIIR
ncbi:hypothetical protein [Allomuricauda sp. SCSIO 65647]|uniref:hypothetical protein n=1 Tax=Allomuricauda sp. SCSIO 65647 TaxID=2908843 RepID=UPI001F44706C|nr:hypothetical protein [Muricauda sp. SCSIO 65647]UJH68474.1 hypothetical protein L0P89_04515 [Muricauda sp. SCSIO 65647]